MTDLLDEKRNGYSLADCAEILMEHTELHTEHGERGYKPHFLRFLRSKGLTEGQWVEVWNDWCRAMDADPALAARFNGYEAQAQQRRRIAKQPNVSTESMGGVTLEQYARISAQVQTGAAIQGLVAAEGLTMDDWQAGQTAWASRMGQCSPTDPILLQYGQLYQKWSPNHQAMMEASTQAILENEANKQGRGGGMSKVLTMENAQEFFGHDDIRVRARGVREMVRIWDLSWDDRDAAMKALTMQAFEEGLRILEAGSGGQGVMALQPGPGLDAMDIHAWSARIEEEQTEQGSVDLVLSPMKDLAAEAALTAPQNEAAQAAIRKAILRLQPRAERASAVCDHVRDEFRRIEARQVIDDYRETLSDAVEVLDEWEYNPPEEAASEPMPASRGTSASRPTTQPTAKAPPAASDGGFMALLKSLPILGDLLRALGM